MEGQGWMLKGAGKMTSELKASTGPMVLQSPDIGDHLRQEDNNLIAAAWQVPGQWT